MKVWELEEGKEYVSSLSDGETKYQLIDGDLYYMNPSIDYGSYMRSGMEYNWAKDVDFTEYTPPTDWSKVEVDTKVLVRDWDDSEWIPKYFAKVEANRVYVWNSGRTSFTSRDEEDYTSYNQTKLYTE